MTPENWTLFWAKLLTLKWQQQQSANEGIIETLYSEELCDIPDAIVPTLRKQLGLLANGWLPSADEILRCAREISKGGATEPASVVTEILAQISAVGYCGEPNLSPVAQNVVAAYGGWMRLCSEPIEHGVLVGMLRKFAADAIAETERAEAIQPIQTVPMLPGNGRKAIEAKG